MTPAWLRANWALVAAAVVFAIVFAAVAGIGLVHRLRRSSRFQLRGVRKTLRRKRAALRRAQAVLRDAERTAERLRDRAERVRPRHLHEAGEAVADARALAKIAHDQVLIAENHLRRIILEEFPPASQERLRAKYGVGAQPDGKPFTF